MSNNFSCNDTVWLEGSLNNIHSEQELKDFIKNNKAAIKHDLASDYFLKCLENHGLTQREFNKQIGSVEIEGKPLISRTFISHFLGNRKVLSRDNLFILAIFSKMTLDEVNHFLKYSCIRPFYPKDRRDYLLQFIFTKNSQAEDSIEFYHEVEATLMQSGFRPLCNKIKFTSPYEQEDFLFLEADTTKLGEGLVEASSELNFSRLFKENSPYLANADYLKNKEATKYLLKCCQENGLEPADLVNEILTYYEVSASHVYHVLNIKNESNIKAYTTRDGLIAYSIIGGLRLDQVNRVLQLSGFAPIYAKNKRDFCLAFCILEKYDYYGTELELIHQGLKPLNASWIDQKESSEDK